LFNLDPILEIKDLTTCFSVTGGRKLVACNKINLQVFQGETLGIVGESGCGKSTLARTIMQLTPMTDGVVLFKGKDITKFKGDDSRQQRRNIQMVFQDPTTAFNPNMKIKDIICEPLLNFNIIKKSEIDAKIEELLSLVGLSVEFKNRYPHNMSGGQRQRVGLARALSLDPPVVICDEATSALDVSVQEKIIELLVSIQKEKGTTFVFICHDLALVQAFSHRTAVMYLGNVVEIVNSSDIANGAKHPYSKALLKSVFYVKKNRGKKIEPLESEIPSPLNAPSGCPFRNRCDVCMERCAMEKPKLKEIEPKHFVACHLCD
jgi:oligopeptide/dipeptide ABC transporter, ATP-binding protein, C-terminal domain